MQGVAIEAENPSMSAVVPHRSYSVGAAIPIAIPTFSGREREIQIQYLSVIRSSDTYMLICQK